MIVTDDEPAISEPSVASVVVREDLVVLSLVDDRVRSHLEGRSIKLQVLVEVLAGHDDDSWVGRAERDLLNGLLLWIREQVNVAEAPLLVPVPDDDSRLRLAARRHEQLLILRAEICRDVLLGRVLGRAQDLALLERHIENRLRFLLNAQLEELSDIVDSADSIGAFLADGKDLAACG